MLTFAAALLLAAPAPKVLESKPCPAQAGTYEDYVARNRAYYEGLAAQAEAEWAKEADKSPAKVKDHENNVAEMRGRAGSPMPKPAYEAAFKTDLDCQRFVYTSDGLKVVGYVMKKRDAAGKLPIVLWLRGGNRDYGRVDDRALARYLAAFARQGYLAVTTQYRGAEGSEGKDEFGGADVADVLNLATLARAMPGADPKNLYVYGASRGGMMVYLSLRRGLAANAAVVHAAAADLEGALVERPLLGKGWDEMIPDYHTRHAEVLRARSAVHWADEIDTPLLLLHGTDDWRVPVTDSLRVAERRQRAKKPYSLIVYNGDDHALSKNFDDVLAQTFRWFAAYKR